MRSSENPSDKTSGSSGDAHLVSQRKQDHLDLCRSVDVSSNDDAGWDRIRLPHSALPEINFKDLDLSTRFLGFQFSSPFLISGMTGGSPEGEKINGLLAQFAEARKIPMGVGSQRVAVVNRDAKLFRLRDVAPRAVLFANIGAVQLNYGIKVDDLKWILDQLQAQALVLHCNPLQEAIQAEGDRNFSQIFTKISELKKSISVPVILKETGCGLDALTCRRAIEAGVDALDIAGLGGTHWGFIEGLRAPARAELGKIFRNWGIPTAQALVDAREAVGHDVPIIASGGIRNGLDATKALYLGADMVGMALPFLKAAGEGMDGLNAFLDLQQEALKVALFCMGAQRVATLKTQGDKRE